MRITDRIEIRASTRAACRELLSSLLLLALACAAPGQSYSVTGLGTAGGANSMAYGINNHEQVVGAAQTAMGDYHGFMFNGGRMVDLGTMGGSNSWACGINDNGWLVGAADLPLTNMHAFLCTNALMNPILIDLGTLGGSNSAAWMVNMHGDVVGWAAQSNGTHHAFLMTNSLPGAMMDLGTAGGTNSAAYCINSNRLIVGYAMMPNGMAEPIVSTDPLAGNWGMMSMDMGGMGAGGGQSWFVNDPGDTVGQARMFGGNHHAFVAGSRGMMGQVHVDLGTLGGTNSAAYCLNNAGTAVGTAQLPNGTMHAFVMRNALGGMEQMMDLNDLIPTNSGWELIEARGINASGQIVGWGMHAGETNAFLLTPVSGPVRMMSGPAPRIVGPGGQVFLQMQMDANEPLTYQWLHDGIPIANETNATLTLSGMTMADAGRYTVTARNAIGTVASASAVAGMFSMSFTNGMVQLTVAAPGGIHFRIEHSDSLGSGANWQTMTNLTIMGSMGQVSDASLQGLHTRFYRAAMVP